MCVVVQRVHAPLGPGTMMCGVANPIDRWVAQIDVGAREIDLQAQHMRAIGELTLLHASKQIEVLLDASVAIWARLTRLGQRPAQLTELVGSRAIDVGQTCFDEVPGELVKPVEVVRSVVKVLTPIETQPSDRLFDGVLVLDVLFDGVGIVKAEMADAAILCGEAEIEADGLGMPNVKVAIGLWREASNHSSAILAATAMLRDDLAQEIRTRRAGRILRQCSSHFVLFMNKACRSTILTVGRCCVIVRYPRGRAHMPRKPHPARLRATRLVGSAARFPQYLWIIVCISCTLDR